MSGRTVFDVIAAPPDGGPAYRQSFTDAEAAAAYAQTLKAIGYEVDQIEIEPVGTAREALELARELFKDDTIPAEPE